MTEETKSKILSWFSINNILVVVSFLLVIIGLTSNKNLHEDATKWIFAAYIIILGSLLTAREFVYSRKARFAEATRNIHQAVHSLRDASESIKNTNAESARQEICQTLADVQQAFSLITGVSCRACIKTIVYDTTQQRASTETFLRARGTTSNPTKDSEAPIDNNTDFKMLFEYKVPTFFSNNLGNENPYLNSNWPENNSERNSFLKSQKYDYIATIVWPIRAKESGNPPEIIGFLCIDSKTRGVFSRRYDIDVGAIVADTLYPILKDYRDVFVLNEQITTTEEAADAVA
jgi:hypothetical protein